jgi:hypothetical protein
VITTRQLSTSVLDVKKILLPVAVGICASTQNVPFTSLKVDWRHGILLKGVQQPDSENLGNDFLYFGVKKR